MSESNEPSYYEIALTNRQVLVAFVLVLASVLGAFLCGVWVGREGSDSLLAQEVVADAGTADELDQLEDFKFFSEEGDDRDGLKKPDLSRLMKESDKGTTLAEDVGSKPRKPQISDEERARRRQQQKKRRQAEQPKAEETLKSPPPPAPAQKQQAPPPRLTQSQTAAAAATEGFIVQVFSTHDEPQARKVLDQLESGGFRAFISKGGEDIYRVRIGPFVEKSEAETAAKKVQRQFKLDTWVTAASN